MVLHPRSLPTITSHFHCKNKEFSFPPPYRYWAWCWIKKGLLHYCLHWISWAAIIVYMNFVWKGLSVTLRETAIYPAWLSPLFPRSYYECHHHHISYAPNSVHRVTTNYQMIWRAYNFLLRRPYRKKFWFTKLSPNVPVFYRGVSLYFPLAHSKLKRHNIWNAPFTVNLDMPPCMEDVNICSWDRCHVAKGPHTCDPHVKKLVHREMVL